MTPRIVGFLSALALCIAGLAWVSVSGQVFVGTPSPPQFAAQGQPSTKNGEWPHYTADMQRQPLLAARSDQRRQLQQARGRVALQDRQPRPASRVQARRHAARWSRACSTRPPARAARSIALDAQDRRADLGAQPARRQARRRRAAPAVGPRRCRTGPTAAATSASSTSRPATGWSRSTRRPARRSPSFGKDGIVDLKVGVVYGNGQQIDLETGEIGVHSTPAVVKDVVDRRLVVPRRRDGQDAQQHQGPGARVRRADRQAAVDVQHDSASRRVRQRDVGERFVGGQRQHRRVDADHASTRSSASSTCRSRRRRRTSTAAIGRATTCSPRASSASI